MREVDSKATQTSPYDPKAIPTDIAELRQYLAEWEHKQTSTWEYRTKEPGWVLCDRNGNLNCQNLRNWVLDVVEWGQRVRHDILRLEAAAGLAEGDPGDPPPNPL